VNLTVNIHPVPRLLMSGVIPLLALCPSMDKENFTYVCTYVYVCVTYACITYLCITMYVYIYNTCIHRCVFFVFLSMAGITGCAGGCRVSVQCSCRVNVQDIHLNQQAAPTIVHISIYCKSYTDVLNDSFITYLGRNKS